MVAGGASFLVTDYSIAPDFSVGAGPLVWLGAFLLLLWIVVALIPSIATST